jgi:kelch-like protein 2/3
MRSVLLALGVAACDHPMHVVDAPATAWSAGPTLPVPRLEPGVTALGVQLVVAGGFDTSPLAGGTITNEVDIMMPVTGTWLQLPPTPAALTSIQLAAIGTTLYLLGGLEGASGIASGQAWSLDTTASSATWGTLPAMPVGDERGGAAVLVAAPRIYLIGGQSGSAALATGIYFDITLNKWGTDVPALPAPRAHPAGMRRSDGGLVIAGGFATTTPDSAAGDTFQLPLGATSWVTGAVMPTPRGECAYGVVEGALVCAGGAAGSAVLTTVQSYDTLTDAWTAIPNALPAPTTGTPGASIGQQLFVPGGARDLQLVPTDTLYVYAPFNG